MSFSLTKENKPITVSNSFHHNFRCKIQSTVSSSPCTGIVAQTQLRDGRHLFQVASEPLSLGYEHHLALCSLTERHFSLFQVTVTLYHEINGWVLRNAFWSRHLKWSGKFHGFLSRLQQMTTLGLFKTELQLE